MKYVQSFYAYPVTFTSIGKGIPCKDADGELKNIAELTDQEYEKLMNQEPYFREMVDLKKYRVLNHLPESYKPAALLVNEANERAQNANSKIAELEAEIKRLKGDKAGETEEPSADETEASDLDKMTYSELQRMAKEKGLEYKNMKRAALIAELQK